MFLFVCSLSAAKSGHYIPITKRSFTKLVEKRAKTDIWIIMLHTDSNYMSKQLYPLFVKASNMASGMFRFGLIDTKKEPLLARQFLSKEQPSYYIFSPKGQIEYTGSGEAEDIIEFASQFLADHTIEIDASWLTNRQEPAAILFTTKRTTPVLWIGVSHAFQNRKVRIGTCRNRQLHPKFNITKAPAILFLNSTMIHRYNYSIDFPSIEKELNLFLSKELKVEDLTHFETILPAKSFESECIGGTRVCVIQTKNGKDEEFEEIRRVFEPLKYKWFQGGEVPFDFMGGNELWVYHPRFDGFLKVSHLTALPSELEKVHAGRAVWKGRTDLVTGAHGDI
jgi:hypothetical protein